ncbi:unnamed protein product, partial [Ectocarpus sp. 12 AP-2014]
MCDPRQVALLCVTPFLCFPPRLLLQTGTRTVPRTVPSKVERWHRVQSFSVFLDGFTSSSFRTPLRPLRPVRCQMNCTQRASWISAVLYVRTPVPSPRPVPSLRRLRYS